MTPERIRELTNKAFNGFDGSDDSLLEHIEAAIRTALREQGEELAKCRDLVPMLPGEMPDEMWEALRSDRDVATEALRILARQTLDEYEEAIRAKVGELRTMCWAISDAYPNREEIWALRAKAGEL